MKRHEQVVGNEWNSAWVLLLVGWLIAAGAVQEIHAPTLPESPPLRRKLDLKEATPRELRRLPGIGPTRAAAIAQARWDRGGEMFPLSQLSGIGPKTAARVAAWLERDALSAQGFPVPPARPAQATRASKN